MLSRELGSILIPLSSYQINIISSIQRIIKNLELKMVP